MNSAAAPAALPEAARPATGRPEKIRLGDVLVQQRLISLEQLQQTLELQRQTGKKVGRLLIESPEHPSGFIDVQRIGDLSDAAVHPLAGEGVHLALRKSLGLQSVGDELAVG